MTTGRGGDAGSFDDDSMSMDDMEALLDEDMEFRSLRRGDVLDGIVMETSREGVLVDIGSKSEGIVPLNEMHSLGADPLTRVKRGDELLVYVLQPESSEGQVILSVDRARGEQGWRTLQKRFEDGESFEGEVTGFNKGGLLVNVEGVNAFVPLSQVVGVRPDREEGGEGGLQSTVGRKLRLKVIEINRRRNRVILSERAAMQEFRSQQKDRLLSELREGEIRRGRITSVRPFGVFVDLGGADGLAHLSELTWERGKTPEEVYRVGDEVDVFVMKVDPETKKIALSLRRAQPERWDEIVDSYRIGQIAAGRVTKLVPFGAFARIDGPVEGLIHVSELSDRRIEHPRAVVHEGDIVPLKVLRIERDKHRIALSLRQARDDAERQGWQFDANGSIVSFPEYLRGEIESKLGAAPARTPDEERDSAARDMDDDQRPPEPQERPERTERQERPQRERAQAAPIGRAEETGAPTMSSVVPDDDAGSSNPFAALRGFRSEADERAAAEAAGTHAAAGGSSVDDAPVEAEPEGTITAADPDVAETASGAESALPVPEVEEGEAETPEGSITAPEQPEAAAEPADGQAVEPEPPPDGAQSRPGAVPRDEEKVETSQ